jgi:hypothetical protein
MVWYVMLCCAALYRMHYITLHDNTLSIIYYPMHSAMLSPPRCCQDGPLLRSLRIGSRRGVGCGLAETELTVSKTKTKRKRKRGREGG